MIRHCDGTDEFLTAEDGSPCACGQTFDDASHRVIYPHEKIVKLTHAEREALLRLAYPDTRNSDTPEIERPV